MIMFLIFIIIVIFYWLFMSPYSQIFGKFIWKNDIHEKKVALSFDDGPNEPYTTQIAEYLHDQGISATFFLVGANIDRFEHTVQKLVKLGHTIGNHSYNHQFRKYFTSLNFKPEIDTQQARIKKAAHVLPALFRPPWLFRTPFILKYAQKAGLTPISGEFCHIFEIFQPQAHRIADRALAKIKPGAIIIFHDGFNARTADRTQTVAAIKLLIPELKRRGYSVVNVNELLSIPAYQTEPLK